MGAGCSIWNAGWFSILFPALLFAAVSSLHAQRVVYEKTSPHHHIRVVERNGLRILSFDNSQETRMSLSNPLQGHFQYTEFFHVPLVWNPTITNVLMMGLGGGSIQRSFQHYYPYMQLHTVELDPEVVTVARDYFGVKESPSHTVIISDARVYLRRVQKPYDLIIMDAYTTSRYGSNLPAHLATREFFELAREKLTENGLIAYNVMGSYDGWQAELLGAVYRTMRSAFPQVYLFPAQDSKNVVLVGVKSKQSFPPEVLRQRALGLVQYKWVRLPGFSTRFSAVRSDAPPGAARAAVLTDDYAPIEGLIRAGEK
jgi:spermidine synthase